MKEKNESIAFAGSTLPILFIKNNISQFNIKKIILSTERLKPSYDGIKNQSNELKVDFLPKNVVLRNLKLIMYFLVWRNKRIIFFHEGGWFFLDLLIILIKPKGYFAPQTNMKIFNKITNIKDLDNPYYKIMYILFNKLFHFYCETKDHGIGFMYMLSTKKYPPDIKKVKSLNLTRRINNSLGVKSRKKILFLVGSDSCSSIELQSIYKKLINFTLKNKFDVYLKDHPNFDTRLNLEIKNVVLVDPNIPAELIEEKFDFVVTSSSASIRTFNSSKISILKLIKSMQKKSIINRVNYLSSISKNVKFPENFESFKNNLNYQ
jgi:hypothetical protein